MTIEESLGGVTRLFLDSAPVIYFVEQDSQYFPLVKVVFEHIQNGLISGITSPVTLAEFLVLPYRLGQTHLQQNFLKLMLGSDHMIFYPILVPSIALNAALLRARYNLQLPDAFQIAVALAAKCDVFLTNDAILKRITELRVLVLEDFKTTE